jgi:hydroxypyruvate isomerase
LTRLAANLKWLFTEWPLARRFEIAARAGFGAVELSLPYRHAAADLRRWCDLHGLRYVYLLSPCGDWEAGERGLACLPERVDEFRDGLARALDYAGVVGCPLVHVSAGNQPQQISPGEAARLRDTYLDNLAWAADRARQSGMRVAIEPICRQSYPDFYLRTVEQAAGVIADVGCDNLGIVFDFHHVQRAGGDLLGRMQRHRERIFHYQLANPPGRNEPGQGEVDMPFCIEQALAAGYDGWFACEYRSTGGTLASLGWAARYGIDTRAIEEQPHAQV